MTQEEGNNRKAKEFTLSHNQVSNALFWVQDREPRRIADTHKADEESIPKQKSIFDT